MLLVGELVRLSKGFKSLAGLKSVTFGCGGSVQPTGTLSRNKVGLIFNSLIV